jgi:hypothetical protein
VLLEVWEQVIEAKSTSLHDAPTINLRKKINDGRDTRCVIEARRRDRIDKYHHDDDNDCFPAFTSNITNKSYPKEFKPAEIPKYDSKQNSR